MLVEPKGNSLLKHRTFLVWLVAILGVEATLGRCNGVAANSNHSLQSQVMHRSPVDLALNEEENWLVSVNQSSNSIALVDLKSRSVVAELGIGERPVAIAPISGRSRFLITCSQSEELFVVDVEFPKLKLVSRSEIKGQPHGLVVDRAGHFAYIALTDFDKVLIWDLAQRKPESTIDVGRWPRYLALSNDESTLAVGTSGDRGISIVDIKERKLRRIDRFVGLNIGHLQLDPNTNDVYFPWMVYRRNPITKNNIQLGWVLASRLGRIRLDSESKREAISLDPPGLALSDPHGIAMSSDGSQIVVSSSGTHELIVLRKEGLPFQTRGSTDHIDPALLADPQRFQRIDVGGRPMGLRMDSSNRWVYVANYLSDSVQMVDLMNGTVTADISLGSTPPLTLERRGEAIFYDARRSLDQWYSCASCHYEGGTNAVTMDTLNDGTSQTFKSIPHLFHLDKTGPWTWHGWQSDLQDSVEHSLRTTMLGPEPSAQDVQALTAYLTSLKPPPTQIPDAGDATRRISLERGKAIFHSEAGGCFHCHSGPYLTDGKIHDLGLGHDRDRYQGYNTPALSGVFRKTSLGHEGKSPTLEHFLNGPHSPEKVEGRELSPEETSDLIEYVKSL